MARPVEWTDERKKQACEVIFSRIENGESCRSILATGRGKDLPSMRLFGLWLSDDDELSKQYAYATDMRADLIADEILEISDNPDAEKDNAIVQRDRLRVDSRKWLLAKLHPKKYGDSIKTEISGEIGTYDITEARNKLAQGLAALSNNRGESKDTNNT